MSWSLSWGELMLVCLVTVPLSLLVGALFRWPGDEREDLQGSPDHGQLRD